MSYRIENIVMNNIETHHSDLPLEQQIELETIRRERAEAEALAAKAAVEADVKRMKVSAKLENKRDKQQARRERADSRRKAFSGAM